jgi:hypothetical protein
MPAGKAADACRAACPQRRLPAEAVACTTLRTVEANNGKLAADGVSLAE